MGLMSLKPHLTMRALLGRKMMTIKCCKRPMAQAEAISHMADDILSISHSEITLKCGKCEKEISIDLFQGNVKREKVWGELEAREYPREREKRITLKARKNREELSGET